MIISKTPLQLAIILMLGLSSLSTAFGAATSKSTESSQNLSIIRLDYDSAAEAPTELQEVLNQSFKPTENRKIPISVYLSLANDFNFLRIVGVKKHTDDFGYTHGLDFKIIGELSENYTLSFNYSTDLYTTPLTGELESSTNNTPQTRQFYTDENILKVILSHKPNNKMFFWRAEAGWIELDSEYRTNYLKGSTHQDVFHDLVNGISSYTTKDPVFVGNGKDDRDGFLIGVYTGLAKSFYKDTDACNKTTELVAGLRSTTLPGTNQRSLEARLVLDCSFRFTKNRFMVETGYQIIDHDKGMQRQQYFDFSTKRTKWKFGFRVENYSGDLVNHVDYNLPNVENGEIDPIFKIYTQRYLK